MIELLFACLTLASGTASGAACTSGSEAVLESLLPPAGTGAEALMDAEAVETGGIASQGSVDGWPVFLDPPAGGFPYTITVFDVDGDGADELFFTGGETFGLSGDGSFLPGWPTSEMQYMGYGTNDQKPGPSCADLEGDGICEILWSERDWYAGSSHMWSFNGRHTDGSNMEGFPQVAPGESSNALDSPFVLGDADGDGDLEAWSAHTLGNTFVYYRLSGFDHSGNRLFTTDLDPAENILDVYFGDVDGNGQDEFFAIARLGAAFRLHAFTPAGTEQSGYPHALYQPSGGYEMFGEPIPVDLDDDGDLEIILGYNSTVATALARHHDGTPVTGFPITLDSGIQLFYLGLGDLNGDDFPELIATGKILADQTYGVWAVDLATGPLPGWPVLVPGWPAGYPTVVEVDTDGTQEVCVVTDAGQLVAIDADGTIEPGYPKALSGASYSGVAAGDIDGDGLYELAAVSTNGYAYAWDTDGVVEAGTADWPMRGVDARNTGVFQISGGTGIGSGGPLPPEAGLEVLGNPASGSVVFRISGACGSIDIFDLGGRRIDSVEAGADGLATWAPSSGIARGLYIAVPVFAGGAAGVGAEFVLLR
ncbi:MAG: VCBS repeat-containing protein [Candidatus Fermentibacter sp.]|nr:VCBS repeat-containing protein [Candidatus Fermentibacter sp.]